MIREDAVYARQSAMREDSISIESQIALCESEIRSQAHRTYVDQGFSGKSTDRPQFQKMMDAVKKGEIKRIICYKLDRCSRSVRDFVSMMELLEQYEVEFISFTEKFDTSSPTGRAMLNICVVFAQLERETIQMRVDHAYKSMSQKGFYMGGRIPFGFQRERCLLNGKQTYRYIPDSNQAFAVRLIYKALQPVKANTSNAIVDLIACNIKNPDTENGAWTGDRIRNIVCNPIYVKADNSIYQFFKDNGAIIHNPPEDFDGRHACYLYEDKSKGNPRKNLRIAGHHLVVAPHEGIVSSEIWLCCRKKFKYSGDELLDNRVKQSWLAGKIKCGKCGYALVIRSVPEKSTRNYACSRSTLSYGTCEGVGKLPADKLEQIVFQGIKKKLDTFHSLSPDESFVADPRLAELNADIEKLDAETENLLQNLTAANAILAKYINERVSVLDRKKALLRQDVTELESTFMQKNKKVHSKTNYISSWKQLTVPDKMKVVDALIAKISVSEVKMQIEWRL